MGERKEEMRRRRGGNSGSRRERGRGGGGGGGRGRDRGGEAQTGSGLVILRYHVLRITVPIHMCVYVTYYVYVCTYHAPIQGRTILLRVYLLFFLFPSLLPLPTFIRPPFLSRPLFSQPFVSSSLHPLSRLLFAAETRVSLAPGGRSFATRT